MATRAAAATAEASPSPWRSSLSLLLLALLLPVTISVLILHNQPADFNPVQIPHYSFGDSIPVPYRHGHILPVSERIGDGLLPGPEDFAYDAEAGVLYASCEDGWIRRVQVRDAGGPVVVEDWVQTGGRPLGLALGSDRSLVVADAYKGLLLVDSDREVKLLTDEAEGLKFKLTDGVDVASNGVIYFTDASYKYNQRDNVFDILEGRPHGRLMSFDPSTNRTDVLVRDLYFANGVAVTPDQQSVIFCETVIRRCQKYHLHGGKKGLVEIFVDNLPGFPDNIRYDEEGRCWIALAVGRNPSMDMLFKYPLLRKLSAALVKHVKLPEYNRDGGVLCVSSEGKPLALYSDRGLHAVTVGLKIGNYLYYGSLAESYASRVDLTQFVDHD